MSYKLLFLIATISFSNCLSVVVKREFTAADEHEGSDRRYKLVVQWRFPKDFFFFVLVSFQVIIRSNVAHDVIVEFLTYQNINVNIHEFFNTIESSKMLIPSSSNSVYASSHTEFCPSLGITLPKLRPVGEKQFTMVSFETAI